MRSTVLSATVAGLLAVPSLAAAQDQPWLKDRRYTEGPGFRVGDFEIHPGAALEFGYDSNYQRLSVDPNAALRLRITPSLYFSTLGTQRTADAPAVATPNVVFRGGISATYNEFIPIGSGNGNNQIENERNIGGSADLGLQLFPGRTWSGNLNASYSRVLTASVDNAVSSFNSGGTLNRDVVGAGAEIGWAPGSGLLEWRLGYQFTGTFFEDSGYSDLNGLLNQVELKGRWRFLPRTSLIFDAKFGFMDFGNQGGAYEKFNSHPLRTTLGINGLVTPSFSVLVAAGWGASFYQLPPGLNAAKVPVQDFDSAIGQAELRWYITPTSGTGAPSTGGAPFASSIAVGFTRDFVDSYIGSTYFERDRGYLNLSYMYAGKLLLVVDGGAGPIVYPTLIPTQAGAGATTIPGFTDIRIDASVFAEYRFKDYFGLNATVRYNQNIDPNNVVIVGQQLLAFTEVEAYIGARWLM